MEQAFSILMFIFSGALLLYAGLMAATKDYRLVPFRARVSVKPKDPKAYAFHLSKVIALTAAAPALSGLIGLWNDAAAVIALIAGFALCLWLGTKIMKNMKQ